MPMCQAICVLEKRHAMRRQNDFLKKCIRNAISVLRQLAGGALVYIMPLALQVQWRQVLSGKTQPRQNPVQQSGVATREGREGTGNQQDQI